MRILILFVSTSLLVFSCANPYKEMQKGNYSKAIKICKKKLLKANKKDKHILILEKAYNKAVKRDKDRIKFLQTENRDENMVEVFEIYEKLKWRQENISSLLPLEIISEGRNANIKTENYDKQIIDSKEKAVKFLYDNSVDLLKKDDKYDARKAYDQLTKVSNIYPGYKQTNQLIDKAKAKGTNNVILKTNTANTGVIIPSQLDNELKKIELNGLNKKWIEYHSRPSKSVYYDYDVIINFEELNLSPNSEKIKEYQENKVIPDGFEYVLDQNGNVKKDSLGNDIKLPKTKTIVANIREAIYHKEGFIRGNVNYFNNANGSLIKAVPFSEQLIYHYEFAELVSGTTVALTEKTKVKLQNPVHPGWPSDEEIIMVASENLKKSIKTIILNSNNYIRD